MPADATVTVTDGVAVDQPYTAHMITADGTDTDVTAQTTFSLDVQYGTFAGADASISGQGAGPTRVVATYNAIQGDTGLTVYVKQHVVETGAPSNAGDLFGAATEDPSLAPMLVYPSDHILVPPNLGQFDVHWANQTAQDNLFEVKMSNEYIDVRLYTTGLAQNAAQPFWTVFAPDVWYPIASTKQTLALSLAGMVTANPGTKGTIAAAQSVDVTNESARGGIYYWSTSSEAIYRYDVSTPNVAPAPFFPAGMAPSSCVGCHSLSRDGTKIAMTLDGATSGRAAVYDVATRAVTGMAGFDFSAFNADATKMFTIDGSGAGILNLRSADGTQLAGPFAPMTAGNLITHPEVSPDNTKLAVVEYTGGADYYVDTGSIVVWDYDNTANTLANPKVLVASQTGVQNYYPSFSPDGQWIAFTRTDGYSYNNPSSEIWVIKADGTGQPILLATSNTTGASLTNSWPRWVPFGQTFGAQNQAMYYLTFSSQRPFGVRLPAGQTHPQIWMTPFFPDLASSGTDPSGNAFRVPFQEVTSSNHIAQWTNSVVIE